jgi:hypothetical protein
MGNNFNLGDDKMRKWLVSSDPKKFDIAEEFAEDKCLYWIQWPNYDVGDIVYIYVKQPVGKVMFKTVVKDESVYLDEDSDEKYAVLCLIEQVDNEELSLENLRCHGLKIPPMKVMEVQWDLEKYIEQYFDIEDNGMWLVNADTNSVKINVFKKHNFVGIGWQLGDLSGKTREEIKSIYGDVYSEVKSGTMRNDLTQINNFVNNIEVGDYIISSNSPKKEYILGKCTSDYYFSEEKDDSQIGLQFMHCRDVEWLYTINWEDISKEARKGIFTVGSVSKINKKPKKEFMELYKNPPFLNDEKRNRIYFGAPGTGKSYKLNEKKDELLKCFKNNYERVTFHPDYTYGNFVGTYKPVVPNNDSKDCSISYEYVPGPFTRTLVNALKNPTEPFLLIIEEINRANVAAVFGDVFQLLDRENNVSQYPIDVSEDIKKYLDNELNSVKYLNDYLKEVLGEDYSKIKIPSNMFIWATMNSADQGVFPMDTAFKRRWDFEYLDINNGADKIENIVINDVPESWDLVNNKLSWNDLRVEINNELLRHDINEDKLIGPFFAFENYIGKELDFVEFERIFENKIIMYLFEDAARPIRKKFFAKDKEESYLTYSKLCKKFKNEGVKIFNERIQKKFIKENGEQSETNLL